MKKSVIKAVAVNLQTAFLFASSWVYLVSNVEAANSGDLTMEMILTGESYEFRISPEQAKIFRGELVAPVEFLSDGKIPSKGLLTSSVIVAGGDIKILFEMTDVLAVTEVPFTEAFIVKTPSPVAAAELTRSLQATNKFRFVHPDLILPIEPRSLPTTEPYFGAQWNLKNTGQNNGTQGVDIGVEAAWLRTRGNPETLVAILDVGFEQNHKDLNDAWFVNLKEIPGNKKDDDGNGLIDDVSGWNFSTNSPKLIYGAAPNHGTATAGVIGARANGIGITGVCPECKLLPIVVSGRVSEDASAISYALAMGASVMSNSWGYTMNSPRTDIVVEALSTAAKSGRGGKGIPILFAMRNSGTDDCRGTNPDISSHPDVIAVSSVDFQDVKVPNSGFGKCLAFVAPSSGGSVNGIPATDRPGTQGYNIDGTNNFEDLDFHRGFWGTSAATPQVAGVFALLLSEEPNLTRDQALSRIKASAIKANPSEAQYDPQTGHSIKYGFGRVHAGKLFN